MHGCFFFILFFSVQYICDSVQQFLIGYGLVYQCMSEPFHKNKFYFSMFHFFIFFGSGQYIPGLKSFHLYRKMERLAAASNLCLFLRSKKPPPSGNPCGCKKPQSHALSVMKLEIHLFFNSMPDGMAQI